MRTTDPLMNAARTCNVAIPAATPSGTRKSTRYRFTELGQPTWFTTSASLSPTITSTGEFTTAGGSAGNGSPNSPFGRTGPRLATASVSRSSGASGAIRRYRRVVGGAHGHRPIGIRQNLRRPLFPYPLGLLDFLLPESCAAVPERA